MRCYTVHIIPHVKLTGAVKKLNFNLRVFQSILYLYSIKETAREKLKGVCADIELNSISIANNFTFIFCVYIRRNLLKNVFHPRAF